MTLGRAIRVAKGSGAGEFVDAGVVSPAAEFLGPDVALRLDSVSFVVAQADASPGADLVIVDGRRGLLAVFSGRGDGTIAGLLRAAAGGDACDR